VTKEFHKELNFSATWISKP